MPSYIIPALIAVIASVIGFYIKRLYDRVDMLEEDLKEMKKEMSEVQLNYNDKFQKVYDTLHKMEINIIKKLDELHTSVQSTTHSLDTRLSILHSEHINHHPRK